VVDGEEKVTCSKGIGIVHDHCLCYWSRQMEAVYLETSSAALHLRVEGYVFDGSILKRRLRLSGAVIFVLMKLMNVEE
jgi:hypothetical protein